MSILHKNIHIFQVGVGMCLGSSILFSMSALCIKSDKEREEAMNMQYLMPGKY